MSYTNIKQKSILSLFEGDYDYDAAGNVLHKTNTPSDTFHGANSPPLAPPLPPELRVLWRKILSQALTMRNIIRAAMRIYKMERVSLGAFRRGVI